MPYKIRPQKKKEISLVKVASRSEEMIASIMERPQWIIGGIVLLVVIGIATFTMQSAKKSAEEAAWSIEAKASEFFHEPAPLPKPIEEGEEDVPLEILDETGRLKKAAELYEEILSQHAESDAAMIALFESGNVYATLDMNDKAEAQYLAFIQKYRIHKELLVLSHLRLGYLYQKKGDPSAAIAQFRQVYAMPEIDNKDQAGFELARGLEVNGQADEAKSLYETLSTESSESPWGTEAKARLALLASPEETTEPETSKIDQPEKKEEKTQNDSTK